MRAALLRRQLGIEDQLHEPEHGIHRGPDLVAHVREECGTRAGDALGEIAGLPHDPFGALGRLFADCESRRHAEVIHQGDVCAPGNDRHSEGEDGDDDCGREVVAPLARGQRHEDGKGDAGEEAADAERVGGERCEGTRDDPGEHDEEERAGLERHEWQHQRTAHPPGDGKQGHGDAYAVADGPLGQPARGDEQPRAAQQRGERHGAAPAHQHGMGRIGPCERHDDGDEERMYPDAEPALAHEPRLQEAGEVGADALVGRDGVFRTRFVHEGGSHDRLHGTI